MESWELEFEWLQVRDFVKNLLKQDKLPDLNIVLMLVGIQEFGRPKSSFTKEEKQDLMHLGVCRLLSHDGYYEFEGRDADGWPHYRSIIPFTTKGIVEQEIYLKTKIVEYFKEAKLI